MVHSLGLLVDFLQKTKLAGVIIPVDTAIIRFVKKKFLASPSCRSGSINPMNSDAVNISE
jgi:hypothetical protein